MSGFVRIHRTLIGHPAFRNDAEAMAFAWMVVRAAWKPVRVRYKERAINLGRGQLAISVRDFAIAMDRDKAWIERLLKRLKAETMIETRNETGVNVITIANYGNFQDKKPTSETASETLDDTDARQGQDTEQRREEIKKEEKEANASSSTSLEITSGLVEWNRAALQVGWPRVTKASDPRRKALRSILREHGPDGWRAAIAKAATSPLLSAHDPPTWFTFDWIVKPANFLKLIEGNYDRPWQSNAHTVGGHRPDPLTAALHDAIAEEAAEREHKANDPGAWSPLPPRLILHAGGA